MIKLKQQILRASHTIDANSSPKRQQQNGHLSIFVSIIILIIYLCPTVQAPRFKLLFLNVAKNIYNNNHHFTTTLVCVYVFVLNTCSKWCSHIFCHTISKMLKATTRYTENRSDICTLSKIISCPSLNVPFFNYTLSKNQAEDVATPTICSVT